MKGLDSRWIINLSIMVLALAVLALTIDGTLDAYREYHSARHMVRANALADAIIVATAISATERGMTAATLGSASAAALQRRKITELRTQSETAWRSLYGKAREMTTEAPFLGLLTQAERAHEVLRAARARVDLSFGKTAGAIGDVEWIAAVTGYIDSLEQLRRGAFLSFDAFSDISALNLSLRHWVWLASEYAGLERGNLAYYISARQPVPAAIMNDLKAYRGVVDNNLSELRLQETHAALDPRLRAAIHTMQNTFLGAYDARRRQVYADADTGNYQLSGTQWLAEATTAIDSILAISYTVSRVADEMAHTVEHGSLWHLTRHGVLLSVCLLLTGLSLTKVRHTTNALFREKELAEITLHSIGDAVITTDAQARVEYLNPIAEELTGWRNAEAHGRPLREVFPIVNGFTREPDPNPVEQAIRDGQVVGLGNNTVLIRRDGTEFTVEDSAAPIHDRDGRIVGAVMVFYDVSTQRGGTHLLSYYATHDALTGLTNRREFERRLSELLSSAKRLGQHHSLCYIDLDQFKVVNDTCGHAVGDKLLRQLTYLLRQHVRDSDTLARLGGDEFGVLLENCSLDRALLIADGLRKAVKNFRFTWEDKSFELGSSTGLVPITPDSVSPAEVLAEADAACYAAKEKGRNRVQVYEPGNLELTRRTGEMQWVSRITQALQEQRFELYCQLIAPLNAHGWPHHEVLLRLRDENGELIPPMSFIPAAERYNLMPDIDRWVIHTTLGMLAHCGCALGESRPVVFTLNLSGASLNSPGLIDYIREQLALHSIDPRRICFEVTETVAIANLEQAAGLIKELKAAGCLFALDDFGSGLSSFTYLKHLPVDYLKIDGSFVRDIVTDPIDFAMVEAINTIGHVMGIRTIAEFAESDAILAQLRKIDVDYAQGYGVQRPRPLASLIEETALSA